MSKEKVRHFYNSLAKESDLQRRLQERSARFAEELKGDVPEEERMEAFFLDAMLPVVREVGFDFSYADLKAYAEETSAGELADEELAVVSGGGNGCFCLMWGAGEYNGGTGCQCTISGHLHSGDMSCTCHLAGAGS